jgi:acyl-CoA reductase-like NAD-dependent aldehyde dehydrogenase
MGAMISEEQFERTLRYVDLARATPGVRILYGGARPDDPVLQKGLFYEPTLIDGLANDASVCQDEIFGPVACVLPWSDFDEVIRDANASPYGLAAALWTRDLSRAMQFVKRIEAGFVQVNQYAGPKANVAYGGLKMSGIGKEYSLESMLEHFTRSKSVIINQGTPGTA